MILSTGVENARRASGDIGGTVAKKFWLQAAAL